MVFLLCDQAINDYIYSDVPILVSMIEVASSSINVTSITDHRDKTNGLVSSWATLPLSW